MIYNALIKQWSKLFTPQSIKQLILDSVLDKSTQELLINQDLWRFKEISGFILISDLDSSVQVLSLGTGTKCVSSQNLSLNGDIILDSHAEIIARRGLKLVLFEHLEALIENDLQGTFIFHIST